MKNNLSILVDKANSGDSKALELLLIEVKDFVYNLSLKMLLFPEDAKDATQEILIKVITQLSTFNNQSQFKTWVYRVAVNYLLTQKKKRSKEFAMNFNDYADLIDSGHSREVKYSKNEGELLLLEEGVKVSCTQGLLLCLNEMDRVVYILSEIFDFSSIEGADILSITSANFRKKLSRSRNKIRSFLNNKCGLANPKNPCRCTKKIDFLISQKIVNPNKLRFAELSNRSIDLISKIDDLEKSVAIYRSVPAVQSPVVILKEIKRIFNINQL